MIRWHFNTLSRFSVCFQTFFVFKQFFRQPYGIFMARMSVKRVLVFANKYNIFQRKFTWISTKVILATFSSAVMFKRQAQTMYLLRQKTAIDFDTSIELMCLNVCSSLCASMRECVFVCMCKRENGWAYVIMLNYTYYISKWLEYSYPDYWFTKYSFALFLYLFAIRFAALGYGAVLVWLRILCCQSTSMWIDIKFTIIGIGIALTEHHFNMY